MVEIKSEENNTVQLPNNIRQVGTPGEKIKIYIEDYVMTYLNQMTGEKPALQKAALLLGEKVKKESTDIYFISAAVAVVPMEWKEDRFKLSSDEWTALYDKINHYFKNRHILGWFLSRPGQAAAADGEIEKIHSDNFKDKGPIFYSQNRIGKDGKNFKMYKFRSMVMGADEKLEKYLQENEDARREYKINKKLKDDPRVTKIGKFIRKTSIDEFPQFINVLKGEMSLVGPRPYLPREIEDMGYAYPYITAVKPGVTGLWQVKGRNDVTFKDRLDLDMEYFENKNLLFEIKILFWTVSSVVHKKGAK